MSLPGVPNELRYLVESTVIPHLKERFQIESIIVSRTLKCLGLTESYIDEALDDLIKTGANPTIGLLAQMQLGEIHVRLTAKAANATAATALIEPLDQHVRQRLEKPCLAPTRWNTNRPWLISCDSITSPLLWPSPDSAVAWAIS